jgi:hypothetical protein
MAGLVVPAIHAVVKSDGWLFDKQSRLSPAGASDVPTWMAATSPAMTP